MPLLSVRAYARHRGVSHTAVLQAIKAGRITRRKDGKINSATADRQWANRTDHSKPRNSVTGDPKHRRDPRGPETPMGATPVRAPARAGSKSPRGNGHAPPPEDGAEEQLPPEEQLSTYARARGERETYLAKKAQLDYELAIGKLVDVEDVKRQAFEAARAARDNLLALPARLAPVLTPVTDESEIRMTMEEALRQVCELLGGTGTKPRRKRGKR